MRLTSLHKERTHVVTATVSIDEQGPHQDYFQNRVLFSNNPLLCIAKLLSNILSNSYEIL